MPHGTTQAVLGLGDGSVIGTGGNVADADNTLDALVTSEVGASEITIADAGSYTAQTTVEAALQEVYGKLPSGVTLAADYTIGTDATPNATGLALPVRANTTYAFELAAIVTASTNCGVRFGWTVPAAATMETTATIIDADDSLISQPGGDQTNEVNYLTSALSEDLVLIKGRVVVGATAGTFTVKFAQDTSHGDISTLHAESTLVLVPLTVA
jgi:hypothetical protein